MFSDEDVILLAKTVIDKDNAFCYWSGDYEDDYWWCQYCGEKTYSSLVDNISHKLDCPYLVARDILTGLMEV